jgi:Fe2+ transport system protein FeoA
VISVSGTPAQLPDCRCPLLDSEAGRPATVIAIACGDRDACRLRAMGMYEGATVSVINKRHVLLVDVQGTRLAMGTDLAQGITVQPQDRAAP